MSTSLQEVLGYRNLTGIAQAVLSGVPADILPAPFMQETRRIEGDRGSYKRVNGNRQLARAVHYGSPSIRREQLGIVDVPFVCIHSVENMFHDMTTLTALERYDSPALQELGQQEIARQTREFATYFTNLRISSIYSALSQGAIYFDSSGNMLPSSTGADTARTVDYGISSDHNGTGTTVITGCGGTFASWATAGTDIIGQVNALKEQSRKDTGYPIRHAFYGANLPEHFASNTTMANLINGSSNLSQVFASGVIPQGLLGLQWHPFNEAFFVDSNDATQDWCGANQIVFTPEPSTDWWDLVVGSYAVPSNVNVVGDANSAAASMSTVYGQFSYAHPSLDPPGVKQVAGDTFLPVLKVPDAIFIITDVTS